MLKIVVCLLGNRTAKRIMDEFLRLKRIERATLNNGDLFKMQN